jgi:hypothetical protein
MVTVPTAPTAQPSPTVQARRRRGPLSRGGPLAISGLSALSPALAARLFAYFFTRPRRQKLPSYERDWLLHATAQPMRLTSGELVPLYEWRSAPCLPGVRD